MPIVKGTRVYWRPPASTPDAQPAQILKNSGYVSVTLQAVQYKARGDWWQRSFGGSDKITVSTQVTWLSGGDHKTAAIVQDLRKISVPSINALAIGRLVVLKVPASADGLELQLSIHAVHDDNLGKTLQLLNSEEFKQPLQLAPVALGEILSVAAMVKKTFTDVEDDPLMATYPGIISAEAGADPIALSRLVEGYIIVIVKQDDADLLDFEPGQLSVSGNRLLASGQPIQNTYMVYNISFDKWRGVDPTSASARKFADASSKVDELLFASPEQKQGIVSAAHDLLMQGKGILDTDDTYRTEEKTMIATAAFRAVADKIKANMSGSPLAGIAAMSDQVKALPLLAAAVEPPEKTRHLLSVYVNELSDAGLPLGFVLNSEELSSVEPSPQLGPSAVPVAASTGPMPFGSVAFATTPALESAGAACAVQTFPGITSEKWQCLRDKASADGIAIDQPQGEASRDGVTIGWSYDESSQSLQISCKHKPLLVPCSVVMSKLRDLVDGCASS